MNNISYEEATDKLDKIINKIESGNISMDEALKELDEGLKLIKYCYTKLDQAKGKLTEIKITLNGLEETQED